MTLATLTCSPSWGLASAGILLPSAQARGHAPMRHRTQGVSRVTLGARGTGSAAPSSEPSTCSTPVQPPLSPRFAGPRRPQPTVTDKLHLQREQERGRQEQLCLRRPAPPPVDQSLLLQHIHTPLRSQPSPSHMQVLWEPSGCRCTGNGAHSPALAETARPSLPAAAPRQDTPVQLSQES